MAFLIFFEIYDQTTKCDVHTGILILYLEEQQKVQTNELLEKLIESFRTTVELYRRLMFEILGGGTEGWNSLFEPVDKTCYPEIVSVLEKLKASEERNVELAKCVADGR